MCIYLCLSMKNHNLVCSISTEVLFQAILIAEVIQPMGDLQNLPEDLKLYKVRETVLSRKIPVTINDDVE